MCYKFVDNHRRNKKTQKIVKNNSSNKTFKLDYLDYVVVVISSPVLISKTLLVHKICS